MCRENTYTIICVYLYRSTCVRENDGMTATRGADRVRLRRADTIRDYTRGNSVSRASGIRKHVIIFIFYAHTFPPPRPLHYQPRR